MADRVGVINKGEIMLVEDKVKLMKKLGQKHMTLQLLEPLSALPAGLTEHDLALADDGLSITYTYDTSRERTGITSLLGAMSDAGIRFKDLETKQSSLEEIFVDLVKRSA
jgi:ABC-2 type transport system ATP-binding protein